MTSGAAPRNFPTTYVPAGAASVRDRATAGDHRSLARRAWTIHAAGTALLVHGARAVDLGPVAAMHRRCSPATLLERFRAGGSPPSASALQHLLSRPLTVVVCTDDGTVVAWGAADPDLSHPAPRPITGQPVHHAEVGIIVDDAWQSAGIGRALFRHLAAAAQLSGRRELIVPAGTALPVSMRLLGEIGAVRRTVIDGEPHLRVSLSEAVAGGLGALQRLGADS